MQRRGQVVVQVSKYREFRQPHSSFFPPDMECYWVKKASARIQWGQVYGDGMRRYSDRFLLVPLLFQVDDDQMGSGMLVRDVLVDSPKVLSVIEILSSSYGHPRNAAKTYDISSKLRSMVNRQVRGHHVPRLSPFFTKDE